MPDEPHSRLPFNTNHNDMWVVGVPERHHPSDHAMALVKGAAKYSMITIKHSMPPRASKMLCTRSCKPALGSVHGNFAYWHRIVNTLTA